MPNNAKRRDIEVATRLNPAGPPKLLFTIDHSTFDIQFSGIGFQASAGGSFLTGGGNVLWSSYFRDENPVDFAERDNLPYYWGRNQFRTPSKS